MLKTNPAVFAVDKTYQIMVATTSPCLFWVQVGEEEYYDESNGIMRSICDIHRVIVPMKELDAAGKYTVCCRPLIERMPYFSKTAPVENFEFKFNPVPQKGARAYHISDAHNWIDGPVDAAKSFGKIDFLILNGDVIDHSGDPSKFDNVYEIVSKLTGGNIPTVFSRGNHDMRGNYAEKFAEFTPNSYGNTYYTFSLGSIWGILLDCGEDKDDWHEEYGYTVCCHAFRKRQLKFLKDVISRKHEEYDAPGVTTRLVISHNPFTHQLEEPFDIEKEIYTEWAKILKENVHPDLMICGHLHRLDVWMPGCEGDHLGQPCPLVISATPRDFSNYGGTGFVFGDDAIEVAFTNSSGEDTQKATIER